MTTRMKRIGLTSLLALVAVGALVAPRLVAMASEQPVLARDRETRRDIRESRGRTLPRDLPLELVVTKSRYRLDVVAGSTTLKTYPIALGSEPRGAKRRQGDEKTPEGRYVLVPHHQSPGFGPCFYVCYPGKDDAARGLRDGLVDAGQRDAIVRALRAGKAPPSSTALGGLILIHGTRDRSRGSLTEVNWTQGCIALENEDVDELLSLFEPSDRPVVTIRP